MKKSKLITLFLGSIILLIILPFFGQQLVSISDVFSQNELQYVFVHYRLPRVIISFLAGAMLALGGLLFQSIFANVLATPYTLGISSAASLGAILAIYLNLSFSLGIVDSPVLLAVLFSMIFVIILYLISRQQKIFETSKILLLGIALNFLCTSIVLYLQFRLDYLNSFKIMHWLVGSMQNISYEVALLMLVVAIICLPFIFLKRQELDLLSLGEEFALSKGVEVKQVQWLFIIISSLLVGTVTAFLGPIAFVGLIIPNIARMWLGAKHSVLIIASFLLGGMMLSLADLFSRVVFAPVEMPVGIFTAFLGALFFLYMVLQKK